MSVTVSRAYSNLSDFIMSTWFHDKAGDEAVTCSMDQPISKERILDHGCSYVLRGSGIEKELYQEYHTEYKEGDVLNDRFPGQNTVTATSDNSVWCYICDKDSSKFITGQTLFVPEYKIIMLSSSDKPIYIACPHEDVQIDGELLNRSEIKKLNANDTAIITSTTDVYIATFTYD